MLPTLHDMIQDFLLLFQDESTEHIVIQWHFWTNNHRFLSEIAHHPFFADKNILILDALRKKEIKKVLSKSTGEHYDTIFFFSEAFAFHDITSLLEAYHIRGRIIFTGNPHFPEDSITPFLIPEFSFRQYAESQGTEFSLQKILGLTADMTSLESLASEYLKRGSFPGNLENDDTLEADFSHKIATIQESLFEKEYDDFMNFIRSLALEIGSLFKEDFFAKNLGVSRRKIRKFTELLLNHDIIRQVDAFSENGNTELSRHSKVYFSDLSYYRGALGITYGSAATKMSIRENFVFLELSRKLDGTHELLFWRKKSGTGIAFILRNLTNNKLTPIEISTTVSSRISQTMKGFYQVYGDRVEHGMSLTERDIQTTTWENRPFFILPYYTI